MLKPDLPFARDDANRFLPWMIAMMCAMAALMLCLGLTLGQWVRAAPAHAEAGFTVQAPPQAEKQGKLKSIVDALEKFPGVQNVRLLTDEEVRELVAPWVGGGETVKSLPLPAVIEASNAPGQTPDYAKLERQLQEIAPDVSVDTQAVWAEKFAHFGAVTQAVAYVLALAIVAALSGMMVFTARAAMKLHAGSVQLLHGIGADDGYIARQFQANALRLALRGAVPGTLAATALYGALSAYASSLNAPLLPGMVMGTGHALMLLLLPLLCCAVSVVSVRLATLRQLRRLP